MKIQCATCDRADYWSIGQLKPPPGWTRIQHSNKCPDCRARERSKFTRIHAFAAGFVASGALWGLVQDIVGQAAYLKWVAASWTPAKYTLPLEIFALLCCAIVLLGATLATWADREDG